MVRVKNTTFVSMAISLQEKATLDNAARKAGVNRNRFIRDWIATLDGRPPRKPRPRRKTDPPSVS